MNKLEKISISRIISDLIKADTIIDSREMDLFKSVKSTYRLSQDCLCDARFMTFSDAVNNLAVLEETEKQELIELYENDFSKHNGKVNSGRILLVFRSIVNQLAKDNEKFLYGCVREGARAREFEEAIEWLVSAGMVIRINNVSKPEHPLNMP